MKVTVCGSSAGYLLIKGRSSTAYIVQHEDKTLLLDCGPGSLQSATDLGFDLTKLDGVMISHRHADHILDLAALVARCAQSGAAQPWLVAPPDVEPVVEAAVALARSVVGTRGGSTHDSFHLPAEYFAGHDERGISGFVMRSANVPHDPELTAVARRLTAGNSVLVYSGDVGPEGDESIVALAAGASLLIHDCYSESALVDFAAKYADPARVWGRFSASHTELRQVTRRAEAAGVKRLVLTHLLDTEDEVTLLREASGLFSGEVFVARDGLSVEV